MTYTPSEPATDHGGFYGAGAYLLNTIPTCVEWEFEAALKYLAEQPDAEMLADMLGLTEEAA